MIDNNDYHFDIINLTKCAETDKQNKTKAENNKNCLHK